MNCFAIRCDQLPDFRIAVRKMVTMNSVLSTCSKCAVAAVFAAALALLGSPTMSVRTTDPEMNAAIGLARSTRPAFWASYEAPKASETGHSLKVRFAYGSNSGEHIWMADVKKVANGRYSGQFANAPVHLRGKRAGDVAEFTEADISDWMFLRNGKIVGGETIRPMLKLMTKADAAALRARMETP